MSTSFLDISAALSVNLNTYAVANSVAVAWENAQYSPVTGTKYLRETLLPTETLQVELGTAGIDETLGIYQVDAFTPSASNLGKGEAIMLADGIADQFKRGSVLTYNGVNVRIRSVSRGTGAIDGSWFIIPVFIAFKSYTQPRV
tara:strand:- start:341 stop:772 length:432 start_codon:yes stop_codon:yes gene_type:complete